MKCLCIREAFKKNKKVWIFSTPPGPPRNDYCMYKTCFTTGTQSGPHCLRLRLWLYSAQADGQTHEVEV